MKKLLLLVMMAVVMVGCGESQLEKRAREEGRLLEQEESGSEGWSKKQVDEAAWEIWKEVRFWHKSLRNEEAGTMLPVFSNTIREECLQSSDHVLVADRKLDLIGNSVQDSGVARVIEKSPTAIQFSFYRGDAFYTEEPFAGG